MESYLVSEIHHGRPGLSAAKKAALVRELTGEATHWIPRLAHSPLAGAREVAAHLIAPLWHEREDFDPLVSALADDPDWEVREWAVEPFVSRYSASPDRAGPQFVDWAESASDGVKRALALAVKSLARDPVIDVGPLLTILDQVARCEAEYVRKNLGPFVVGDGVLLRHPVPMLEHLAVWAQRPEWPARWNAAAAFTAKRSQGYVDVAAVWLADLVKDSEDRVRRVAEKVVGSMVR